MNLLQNLGLDSVEADPNSVPDGKYDGIVSKSEYVIVPAKNTISHVITYSITDGDRKGAQATEWFKIGTDPVDANGNPCDKVADCTGFTPAMSEAAKPWYKKRWVDLGVAEEQVGRVDLDVLNGTPVTFGLKTKNGYQNVNFVERRESASTAAPSSTGMSLGDL